VELERQFAREEARREYLFRVRWPEGFICPHCHSPDVWRASRGRLICQQCTSRSRGKLFYRLLQQAVQVDLAPYKSLIARAAGDDHNL
jgi:ribosomal protein L37AE/L43A